MDFPASLGLPGQSIAFPHGVYALNEEMILLFTTADSAERGCGYCQIPET